MKRTTISLPDELAAALDRESRRRATPVSAIAREALTAHLGIGTAESRRELGFASLGRSDQLTTARDMEELLSDEWSNDARGS